MQKASFKKKKKVLSNIIVALQLRYCLERPYAVVQLLRGLVRLPFRFELKCVLVLTPLDMNTDAVHHLSQPLLDTEKYVRIVHSSAIKYTMGCFV